MLKFAFLAALAFAFVLRDTTATLSLFGYSDCPDGVTSTSSSVCPTGSKLADVRKGAFKGVAKGAFVPHYSCSLNKLTTATGSVTYSTTIYQCSSSCTATKDCEYWTWEQSVDRDDVDSGTCYYYNIDQCGYSQLYSILKQNFDKSASLSFSGGNCDGSGSSGSKPSPPPPKSVRYPPPPVGVTTSPPPADAPCPPGVKGDPHFAGWDGVHFDFTGRPGQSYCLLTDDKVHVNMFLEGYSSTVNGSEDVHTWIKGMGILSGAHKLALYARSGKEAERGDGYMKQMLADGKEFTLLQNESLTIGSGDGAIRIEYKGHRMDADDDIDVYEVEVAGSIKFLLKMRPEVPVMRLPDNAWVHFSMEILEESLSQSPHGILGQTLWNLHNPELAPEGYSVQYSGILWAWQVAGRDGDQYIQGKPRDYLTSNVLAADCKYGKLEGAFKKQLGVFSSGCNRKALVC